MIAVAVVAVLCAVAAAAYEVEWVDGVPDGAVGPCLNVTHHINCNTGASSRHVRCGQRILLIYVKLGHEIALSRRAAYARERRYQINQ